MGIDWQSVRAAKFLFDRSLIKSRGNGKKEINSHFAGYCCEAATESMMSSKLPEYIYSITTDGLNVNLFAASTITNAPEKAINIRIRVPSWATGKMEINIWEVIEAAKTKAKLTIMALVFVL